MIGSSARAVRVAAAWLVAASWLLLPVPSAFAAPIGPRVTGGPSAQQATKLTSGVYQAAADQDRDQYFLVERQWPGSRIWTAVNLLSEPGTNPELVFEPTTPDGQVTCIDGWVAIDSGDIPIFSIAEGFEVEPECANGDILLRASLSSIADGTPYQILIWEEPEPTNLADYSASPEEAVWVPDMPTGEPKPVSGGAGWASAPTLTEGVYSTEVGNGQIGLFRTPLEFGQYVQVEARMTDPPSDFVVTHGLHFYNPFGAEVDTRFAPDAPNGPLTAEEGEPEGFTLPVVTWVPPEDPGDSVAALAGDYYFAFDLTSPDLPESSTVEFSLNVITDPDAATAAPVYAVTPAAQPSLIPKAPATISEPSHLVSYLLFGVSGCFAVAGAVLLGRTRRSRRAMQGWGRGH